MSQHKIPRRTFLARSSAALAATGLAALYPGKARSQPMGANESIGVGIVGLGIKGVQHLEEFGKVPGVRIVALCDADQSRMTEQATRLRNENRVVSTYQDFRDLLEDPSVDAVVLATPNHWHALMTIWACQAGKDVYVEKPVSHGIWEGQRMLEAAQKYSRVIQGGTQNRSNLAFDEGVAYLNEARLGNIKGMHAIRYTRRLSIGKVRGPQAIPESVDYNLFQGPAPMMGLNRTNLHYDWHWQWATGNGDMGNNAAHAIDDIRRILGDERQPDRVMSVGGRFVYDDDAQTPNAQITLMDYGTFPVLAEIRNLPHKTGVDYMDHQYNIRHGTVVVCEGGYMTFGWGGANAYSPEGKRIRAWRGDGGKSHAANFIQAVRDGNPASVNCPLQLGTQAGEIFHLANISHRSGFPGTPQRIAAAFAGSEVGEAAWDSLRGHLERNGVDLERDRLTLGSWISLVDGGRALRVADADSEMIAQYLFRPRNYRSPFIVPEKI